MTRDRIADRLRDIRDWFYANRYYLRGFVWWPIWLFGPQLAIGNALTWWQAPLGCAMVFLYYNLYRNRDRYRVPRYYFYRRRVSGEAPGIGERVVYGTRAMCVSHTFLDDHLIAKFRCGELVSKHEVEEELREYLEEVGEMDRPDVRGHRAVQIVGSMLSFVGGSPPTLPPLRGGFA